MATPPATRIGLIDAARLMRTLGRTDEEIMAATGFNAEVLQVIFRGPAETMKARVRGLEKWRKP